MAQEIKGVTLPLFGGEGEPDYELLLANVGEVFRPSSPVQIRDFFAGRRSTIAKCLEAIQTPGMHIVLHGNRGVGKTSLANVIRILHSMNSQGVVDKVSSRSLWVSCDSVDTYQAVWRQAFEGYIAPETTSPQLPEAIYDEELEGTRSDDSLTLLGLGKRSS